MEDVTDVLIPEEETIRIKDRSYKVKKLSVVQIIKLTRHIVSVVFGFSSKAKEGLEKGTSNIQDVLNIFDHLTERQVAEVIGIVVNESDVDFIEKEGDPVVFTNVLASLFENNNFGEIWGNVQRVMKAVSSQVSSLPLQK